MRTFPLTSMLTSPLAYGLNGRDSVVAFSPISLFAASEPGAWYDPSDLTTLFQDRAGTTPVTAVGQTVGMVLDKSRGLVLGPELVTNGTFDTDTAWTKTAAWSITGGAAVQTTATNGEITQVSPVTLTVGMSVRVTFTLLTRTAGFLYVRVAGNITNALSTAYSTPGTYSTTVIISTITDQTLGFTVGNSPSGFSIDNVSFKLLPGNHLVANSDAARGTYQVTGGLPNILFDGSDDGYISPTITPGTDKAQVFTGVTKSSDAARADVLALGGNPLGANGTLYLNAPITAAAGNFRYGSRGTIGRTATSATTFAAPITAVLTGISDIAGDNCVLRINGAQAASDAGDQGTGDYAALQMFVGRTNATLYPFNGRLFSLIVRFGPNLDAATISQVEQWVATKTGVTL